jgi:hypothetical protein
MIWRVVYRQDNLPWSLYTSSSFPAGIMLNKNTAIWIARRESERHPKMEWRVQEGVVAGWSNVDLSV